MNVTVKQTIPCPCRERNSSCRCALNSYVDMSRDSFEGRNRRQVSIHSRSGIRMHDPSNQACLKPNDH